MKWESVNLGQICNLVNGKAYNANHWSTLGLPIIRIQNLNDIGKPFNYWNGSVEHQVHVHTKDLLIAWSGTPGTSFGAHIWNGPEGVLNQHIFRVDLDAQQATREWVKFCVNFQLLHLIDQAHGGVGLKHVTKGMVESLPIPLPPLAEQKRIAGILDAADALRAKRRESIAQLDALLQSTFLEMFGDPITNPKGWDVGILGNWLDRIDSGWSPSCLERRATENEWGVLKLGAVTRCQFNEVEQKALPPSFAPRPALEVRKGDLLFSRKNTYELVAAAAYVFQVRPQLMLSDLIFRLCLKADCGVDLKYLWQLLVQPRQRQNIQKLAGGAAGSMPNISKAKLFAVPLIRPPIRLQQKYSKTVESVEKQKSRLRAHLHELDTLFSSLQHRAFNGEL